MKKNTFIGAFAIEKNIDSLNASWEIGKNLLPDSSFLKLYYEGSQIEFNSIDNLTVLFQGEIVKYLCDIPGNVKESAIESIIWLYRKFGDGFAKQIDGHFAILIYDRSAEKFLLIQDNYTFHEKIYWIKKEGILYFSNHIKTLTAYSKIDPNDISTTALYQFLRYTYTSPPHTIFRNVFQMTRGEMISIEEGKFSKSIYDTWSFTENRIKDKDEAVALYREVLSKSVNRLYEKHPSSVFLLSGGLDSSLNVALASKKVSDRITSVGICADEKYNTDAPYARMVANLYNTDHREYYFTGKEIDVLPQLVHTMGIPYFEPGVTLSYSAYREAAKYSDFAIGGEAADQIFGYCTPAAHHRYSVQKKTRGLYKPAYKASKILRGVGMYRKINKARSLDFLMDRLELNSMCSAFGFWDLELRELFKQKYSVEDKYDDSVLSGKDLSQLYDYTCTKLDLDYAFYGVLSVYSHLTELHNISCFSTYTDRDVINFALSLDHDLRIQLADSQEVKFVTKYLQREMARDILPQEIIDRPKQGGAVKNSIHMTDQDFVDKIKNKLLNSEVINRYFQAEVIEKLFTRPIMRPTNILLLLNFDLWHKMIVSDPSEQIPSFTLTEYLNE